MNGSPFLLVLALAPVLTVSSMGAASLFNYTAVGASNNPSGFHAFETSPGVFSAAISYSPAGVSTSGSASFSGLNEEGGLDNMSFSGSGSASGNYGHLHTAASGSVSNVIYNPGNPIYYTPEAGLDFEGTPTSLHAFGQAKFEDVFTYGTGTSQAYRTDFYFKIDGRFTGTNTFHSISVNFGEDSDSVSFQAPGDGLGSIIDTTWVTDKFLIGSGQSYAFSAAVLSQFYLNTTEVQGGNGYGGSADFSSTVTLTGINLYDENDNLVSNWTLTSESGTNYPVPEPAVPAFLALGVLFASPRKRR